MSECDEKLAYTVMEAGKLIGLSRSSAYQAARAGELPTVRIGGRLFVPRATFHKMFGDEGALAISKSAA
jgi:excisionase family DNA binding protein